MKKDTTLDALMGLKTAIDSAVSIMETAKEQEAQVKLLDKEVKSLKSLKVTLTNAVDKLKDDASTAKLDLALEIEQKKEKAEKAITSMLIESELLVEKARAKDKKATDSHVALCEELKAIQKDIVKAKKDLKKVTDAKDGLLTALSA